MHPALAAKRPALTFTDAADYLNTAGLTGGSRVQAGELLDRAIRENCVSVVLPLRVRAHQADAPPGRVEHIDGVLALVLDDVGRLEAHWLHQELSYVAGWTVRVTGHQGATVRRDGVTHQFLDPRPEDNGLSSSMPKNGSALPAQAELVISQDALRRFVETLSPAAAPTAPSPVTDAEKAGQGDAEPFRIDELGELAKDPTRKEHRDAALTYFQKQGIPRAEVARRLKTNVRTLRNWKNGVKIGQDLHVKVLRFLNQGPQGAKTVAD